ncbi:MAG TPA: hypothetical protein DCS93_20520 [Microscillaceae bacterium]|nr:hypothetical protein [Microscillaceae bacterium]
MKKVLLIAAAWILFSLTAFAQNDQSVSRLQQPVESGLTLQTGDSGSLFSPTVLEFGKPFQKRISEDIRRIVQLEETAFLPTINLGDRKLQILPNLDWDSSVQFSFRILSKKKKKKK